MPPFPTEAFQTLHRSSLTAHRPPLNIFVFKSSPLNSFVCKSRHLDAVEEEGEEALELGLVVGRQRHGVALDQPLEKQPLDLHLSSEVRLGVGV